MRWTFPHLVNLVCLVLATALAGGCGREDVKVYTVPKESSPTLEQGGLPAGHPDASAPPATPQLQWKLPEGWKESPPGEMRVASFRVKAANGREADVSVVPLPGMAGGDLSNVNRWRGQVSQPSVSEEELKKLVQPVEVASQPAALYEQAGEGPNGESLRILAVIQNREGTAWFFKMTGDSQLVAQQKPVFVEFLKSFQFAADTGLPAGRPAMPADAPTAAVSSDGQPKWTAPVSWREVSGGQFLVAKFALAGEGGAQATVNISSSAGDGGGLAANVNRWRKQLGLTELAGDEVTKSLKSMGPVTLVEMSGERAALVAAIVSQPGKTWFFKLMGDAPVVTAQKDAFTKFVQEVQY